MNVPTYLDYYGFSLLVRVQHEFNSSFSHPKVIPFEQVRKGLYSTTQSIKEYDLIGELFKNSQSKCVGVDQTLISIIGEAALLVGKKMVNVLYNISQWIPDNKRSALIMVRYTNKRKWLAYSISDSYNGDSSNSGVVGGRHRISSESTILVDDYDCEQLCLNFMKIARERGLFKS